MNANTKPTTGWYPTTNVKLTDEKVTPKIAGFIGNRDIIANEYAMAA